MKKKSLGKQIIEGLEEAVRFEKGEDTGATVKGVIPKREWDKAHEHRCSNCKKVLVKGQGHYVVPSLGEPGYYVCNKEGEIDLMLALKNSLRNSPRDTKADWPASSVGPDGYDDSQGEK